MIHLHVFQRCSPILLLFSVAAATPLIYWDVDSSADIDTPAAILRGDRGLPVTQYSTGFNGNATNIYGGRGRMPHFQGATPINGGIPQHGNLSEHIEYYERDLAALIPKEDFVGVCLIDYEFWRADWNSTPGVYRTKSIEATGGDEVLAKAEYEEGARLFMLATINATRKVRPGCQIGWYGYPTNHFPFIPSVSYTNWCSWPQNVGACFFEGYDTPSGEAQRMLNDEILWLFKALDVLTPSVYLGILPDQTTYDESRAYVNSTVLEAVRLAAASGGKSVVPVTWYMTNNYWQYGPPAPREFLNLEDSRTEFQLPFAAGADAILLWGAVNEVHNASALQEYVDTTLSVVLAEMEAQTPAPSPSVTTAPTPAGPSAYGDPHMVNLRNERFDVRKQGAHVFLQIPRKATPEDTYLRVEGHVQHFKNCQVQFIKKINITGKWVDEKSPGGRFFDADVPNKFSILRTNGQRYLTFGPARVKVEYYYSRKGFGFLNFYALSLSSVRSPIGGILGLDDHSYATKGDCQIRPRNVNLRQLKFRPSLEVEPDEVSDAKGSFASARLV